MPGIERVLILFRSLIQQQMLHRDNVAPCIGFLPLQLPSQLTVQAIQLQVRRWVFMAKVSWQRPHDLKQVTKAEFTVFIQMGTHKPASETIIPEITVYPYLSSDLRGAPGIGEQCHLLHSMLPNLQVDSKRGKGGQMCRPKAQAEYKLLQDMARV